MERVEIQLNKRDEISKHLQELNNSINRHDLQELNK